MADSNPTISGYDSVSVGYNYILLSLTILDLTAGMAASLGLESGFGVTVTVGGAYTTNFGPGFNGTAWLAGIAKMEYTATGATSVTVNGSPVTLSTAVAENGGAASKLHAAGARVLAAGIRGGKALAKSRATATVLNTSGSQNSVGGNLSTGGSG